MNRGLELQVVALASLSLAACGTRYGDPVAGPRGGAGAGGREVADAGLEPADTKDGSDGVQPAPDSSSPVPLFGTVPEFCTAGGWCGANLTFSAVWGTGAADVWVVAKGIGDNPTPSAVLRWDGATWTTVLGWSTLGPLSGLGDLETIWGAGPSDVWVAGGASGAVLHWNGLTWTETFRGGAIKGLWGSASNDVWAVGGAGTILHWDGAGWTYQYLPNQAGITTANLEAVWGSGAGDVWAVGDGGVILHWNGTTWSQIEDAVGGTPTTSSLKAVWGRAPDDVWAVGSGGTVLHWNGSAWSLSNERVPTAKDLEAVWGSGSSDVWVAGAEGTLLHFTGDAWYTVAGKTTETLLSVWGSGAGELWVVGDRATGLYWDRTAWSATPVRPLRSDLSVVWAGGATDVWTGGAAGFVAHWDGASWTQMTAGTGKINGIWLDEVAMTAYLASDAGTITSCYPAVFTQGWVCGNHSVAGNPNLKAVWGFSGADVWFGGTGGTILHWNEQLVTTFPVPTTATVTSIWGLAADDVWAATDSDLVLHWDGTAWSATSVPGGGNTGTNWRVVAGTAADDVWLTGMTCYAAYKAGGCISAFSRWNGTGWSANLAMNAPSDPTFTTSAWSGGRADLWAASPGPYPELLPLTLTPQDPRPIMHWDGSTWSRSSSGSRSEIFGISGRAGDLWAVGAAGTVLHRRVAATTNP